MRPPPRRSRRRGLLKTNRSQIFEFKIYIPKRGATIMKKNIGYIAYLVALTAFSAAYVVMNIL